MPADVTPRHLAGTVDCDSARVARLYGNPCAWSAVRVCHGLCEQRLRTLHCRPLSPWSASSLVQRAGCGLPELHGIKPGSNDCRLVHVHGIAPVPAARHMPARIMRELPSFTCTFGPLPQPCEQRVLGDSQGSGHGVNWPRRARCVFISHQAFDAFESLPALPHFAVWSRSRRLCCRAARSRSGRPSQRLANSDALIGSKRVCSPSAHVLHAA